MRILWLCNIILPPIAKEIGVPAPAGGGWLTGAANAMLEKEDVQLAVCFPQRKSTGLLKGCVDKLAYYGFPISKELHVYDENLKNWCKKILDDFKPDMVHIWGTEFADSLIMAEAFNNPAKTVVSIQGMCEIIAKHYCAFLPEKVQRSYTIHDLLKNDSISRQQKKFEQRSVYEKKLLQQAAYAIGRTECDKAFVKRVAPECKYFSCNETLRPAFYEKAGSWNPENCEKHSLFASQANYPVKGFHLILEAMPEILKRFPDAKLYVSGPDPFKQPMHRINSYQKWLIKCIRRFNLRGKVFFLGKLDEVQMRDRYLQSHVFVSASSIENSPNSVGEAMLLGVPVVASYVGGTMDLLKDKEEGFLYQPDATYMLANYVCKVFDEEAASREMGQRASKHALQTHDAQKNFACMMKIYNEVYKG